MQEEQPGPWGSGCWEAKGLVWSHWTGLGDERGQALRLDPGHPPS